jgi:outer membrane protein insertion porin family
MIWFHTKSSIYKTILLFTLFTTISLHAKSVKDIKFEGLVHISSAIAYEIIDIKKGQEINPAAIDESIKKLYRQQYFEDIWVDESDGILTYHFKEKSVIAKVEVTGLKKEKNEEILKLSGIKKGDIYDETKIRSAKTNIRKSLEAQGFFDSVIETQSRALNPGSLQTNIIVNKGENIHIEDIHFIGTKDFGYKDFKSHLANKKAQTMGWFLGRDDGLLKADQLKMDAIRIKEFYLNHGYLDAVVNEPILRTKFDNYKATIIYNIYEGTQYKIGEVKIDIDKQIVNPKTLKEAFTLKAGDVFNVQKLRKDIGKITEIVSNKGYAFTNVLPDIKQDRQNSRANITYVVKPNKKVYVNNITIAGNTRTADSVIRRELYFSETELFNQKDLLDSNNALKRTGYFNNVKIVPKQVEEDKLDLIVNVDEASTGSIMGGLSYGSFDKFGVNAGVSDRNFLGSGIEVGMDIDASEKTQKGSIHFYNPRVFDSLYSLGGNLFKKEFDYYNYNEKSKGGNLKLGRKLGRYTHASLTYLYEDVELTDVNETLQEDNILYTEGRTIKSSLIPSISYDNTDDYYLPRKGVSLSSSFEYAGVGGEAEFLKTSLSAKYYYGFNDLIDYDLILRLKARINHIKDRGNLPLNEKLYLGGMGSVRGFRSGSLAPKNDDGVLIGANKLAAASVELSIPLIESAELRIFGFYDYGMTGDKNFDEIKRSSTGVGFEWAKSPLGVPLQLFYAKALDDKEGDRTSRIEFSLGRRF